MKFEAKIDPAEYALIESVGKILSPDAWRDPKHYKFRKVGDEIVWEKTEAGNLVIDSDMTATATAINERNRARACEMAMAILEHLRASGFRRDDERQQGSP